MFFPHVFQRRSSYIIGWPLLLVVEKIAQIFSNVLYMRSCYPMVTPVDANSRLIVALGQLPEDDSCQFFPLRLLARL